MDGRKCKNKPNHGHSLLCVGPAQGGQKGARRQTRCSLRAGGGSRRAPAVPRSLEPSSWPGRWDRSRREPLGSHYLGHAWSRPRVTQEVSIRKDWPHVPSLAAPEDVGGIREQAELALQNSQGSRRHGAPQISGSGRAAEVGGPGDTLPFPPCPPAPSTSPSPCRQEVCAAGSPW